MMHPIGQRPSSSRTLWRRQPPDSRQWRLRLETLRPGERLFRGLDRWSSATCSRPLVSHTIVCAMRHLYAIRAVRAGTPYELVARPLVHGDLQIVAKVSGRDGPASDEREWLGEDAGQLDAAREAERQKTQKSEKWVRLWVPHLRTSRVNHSQVIGSTIAGCL